jgi:hypothetical protein
MTGALVFAFMRSPGVGGLRDFRACIIGAVTACSNIAARDGVNADFVSIRQQRKPLFDHKPSRHN